MQRERLAVTTVASALSVTPKSVYEWLRGRGPLHPDHVRAELVQKIAAAQERSTKVRGGALQHVKGSARWPQEAFVPDKAGQRLDALPSGYQERYGARVKEITLRARRELDEYLTVLEAEYKAAREKQRRGE